MASKAFVQYSKKMCTKVTVFWMIYRIVVSLLTFIKPDISNAIVHLTDGADMVMIANISVYCGNSIAEKGFYAFGKRKPYNINSVIENNEEEPDEEESNG